MRRLLYSTILAIAAVLVFAPAALAQETKFIPGGDIQALPSQPGNLACAELVPGDAKATKRKAQDSLNKNQSIRQTSPKKFDADGDGVACEYKSLEEGSAVFEDESSYFETYAAREVSRYSHGPRASIGPHRPDQNNVVVEYAGTAGRSHYDNTIGIAIGKAGTPWGYNYYIVYDFVETNRYNYTQTGINVLYRHERAHTRGWAHFEGNKRINGSICPNQDRLGRTYYYNGNRC